MTAALWPVVAERFQLTDPSGGVLYLDGGSTEARIGASVPMLLQPDTPGSGVGRDLTISASPGFSTNARGVINFDLGAPISTFSGYFRLTSSTNILDIRGVGSSHWLFATVAGGGFTLSTGSVSFVDNESGDEAVSLGFYDMASAGVNCVVRKLANGVNFTQDQHETAAGRAWTIRAQRGASGFVGGNIDIGVGLGGTQGANLPGDLNIRLGYTTASRTGRVRVTADDTDNRVLDLYFDAALARGMLQMYDGATAGGKLYTIGSQLRHVDTNSLTEEFNHDDPDSGATAKLILRRFKRHTSTTTAKRVILTIPAAGLPTANYIATVWVSVGGYDTINNQGMRDSGVGLVRRTSGTTARVNYTRYATVGKEGGGAGVVSDVTVLSGAIRVELTPPDTNDSRWYTQVRVEVVAH